MNASKENALKARSALVKLSDGVGDELRNRYRNQIIAIESFIEAATKKLPSEAAFKADKERVKGKKVKIDPANPDACRGPLSSPQPEGELGHKPRATDWEKGKAKIDRDLST